MKLSNYLKAVIVANEKGYIVDEFGNVFYRNRKIKLSQTKEQKYLLFSVRCIINNKSVSKRVKVHKLQAFQKYGFDSLKYGVQVRHFNGNPQDNSINNILIGTHSENQMDIPKEIRQKRADNKKRVVSEEQLINLNIDRNNGMTYKNIMEKYNISSKGTLSYMLNKSLYNNL